jgi:hypothetical protein
MVCCYAAVTALAFSAAALGAAQGDLVHFAPKRGDLPIVGRGKAARILVDAADWPGVMRAAHDLKTDIGKVTGHLPELVTEPEPGYEVIAVGTLGRSALIDSLVASNKLDASSIRGKWEATLTQVVKHPWPGVRRALIIAGSDKRGAIYGMYTLSEQAGVSPWYWWADVPIKKHGELYASQGPQVQGPPAVKYRGIFLNDEAPSLTNWVHEKFGNYNHRFYEHIFELLLRLKANYLWPAMWDNCFSVDDPLNPKLADEYGIVMGTSHVEPMMRADKEWNREGHPPEAWNYLTHPKELEQFWTEAVERNKPYENIVTVGMRGKIDTPMAETANIDLLQRIVAAQRKILAEHVKPHVEEVPQLWCLYKEVQEYYEKGMQVPDDVTLLWADDNWGNVRRLPTPGERGRKGGAGVYYHFDYVGGPRNYKWLNTVQLERVWEQMHLAFEANARRIWIVNVGSFKMKEFPVSFFLEYAWSPSRWDASNLGDFYRKWASSQFGATHAGEIGDLIRSYTYYNARRKPELLSPETYSLVNYNEADTVAADYLTLAHRAQVVEKELPEADRSAFYELVEHPILACSNLNSLYRTVAQNRLYASQGRLSANEYAQRAKELFARDAELKHRFHTLLGGKWNHMMDQTHIGYTSWQQPGTDVMPEVKAVRLGKDGVAVEGDERAYSAGEGSPRLPELHAYGGGARWFEVFTKDPDGFHGAINASEPWLRLSTVALPGGDVRVWVSADWSRVPASFSAGHVTVNLSDGQVEITVPLGPRTAGVHGFVEESGCVSIEAPHFTRMVKSGALKWKVLPGLGKTIGAVTAFPPTRQPMNPPRSGMRLEYKIFLFSKGPLDVDSYLSPTQLLWPGKGLRYAISIDDEQPQIVNMHENYIYFTPTWEKSVADNILIKTTRHRISTPGRHVLKFWAVDPSVVLQKVVLHFGPVPKSYLGPPESAFIP